MCVYYVSVLTGIFPFALYNDIFLLPSPFFRLLSSFFLLLLHIHGSTVLLLPPFTTHHGSTVAKPHPVVVAACHYSVRYRKPNAYGQREENNIPLCL